MIKRLLQKFIHPSRLHEIIHNFNDRIQTQVLSQNGYLFDVSHPRLYFRVSNFSLQEPDLLRWIDQKFEANEVFFDVGANIGFFSIYATRKKVNVYAFEPDSLTCASLNKNIYLNRVSESVSAIPVALSNKNEISHLFMRDFLPGNAYNTFSRNVDHRGGELQSTFRQGAVGLSIDAAIKTFGLPVPNHVKIDVDGNELLVIEGMAETINQPELRTICVELGEDFEEHKKVKEIISAKGFVEQQGFVNDDRALNRMRNFYYER